MVDAPVPPSADEAPHMSIPKRVALVALVAFYVLAGVNHFAHEDYYLPMIPSWLPWPRALVLLSGVAEVALGVGVAIPRARRLAAWGLVALLVAVFPANLHVALHDLPMMGNEHGLGVWNWVRLPFQLPLIAWAWWFTRPDSLVTGGVADGAPAPSR